MMTSDRRSRPSAALGYSRAGVVGALTIPLPLLEIRSPVLALELGKSLWVILLALALAVLAGGVVGYVFRDRSLTASPRLAVVGGLVWLAMVATDDDGVRAVGIFVGLAATTAALLLHVTSDRGATHNRIPDHVAACGGLAIALAYLTVAPDRSWVPVLALSGAIAIVAASGLVTLDRRHVADHHRPIAEVQLGVLPIYPSIANFVIAAGFGATWGALPSMNRLTFQRFLAAEPTASVAILLGGLLACALVWGIDRPSGWTREWRGTLAIATGGALVLASLAPSKAWTVGWWIVALGCGAALLISQINLPPTASSSREVAVAGGTGVVIGLGISAIALAADSIDPRATVATLALPVLFLGLYQRRQITVL
jgi:hypothetical protein